MYAVKLIEALLAFPDLEIHLVITKNGERVLAHETGLKAKRFREMSAEGGRKGRLFFYDIDDLAQPLQADRFSPRNDRCSLQHGKLSPKLHTVSRRTFSPAQRCLNEGTAAAHPRTA
jgi:hypothetical protein